MENTVPRTVHNSTISFTFPIPAPYPAHALPGGQLRHKIQRRAFSFLPWRTKCPRCPHNQFPRPIAAPRTGYISRGPNSQHQESVFLFFALAEMSYTFHIARYLFSLAAPTHVVQRAASVGLHSDQEPQAGPFPEVLHEGVPLVK